MSLTDNSYRPLLMLPLIRGALFLAAALFLRKLVERISNFHSDEAWLIAAFCAALVVYGIGLTSRVAFFRLLVIDLLLSVGTYFFVLKLPMLLVSPANSYWTAVLCLIIWWCLCWLLIRSFKMNHS